MCESGKDQSFLDAPVRPPNSEETTAVIIAPIIAAPIPETEKGRPKEWETPLATMKPMPLVTRAKSPKVRMYRGKARIETKGRTIEFTMVKTKAIRPSMMTVSVRVVPFAMTIPGTSLAETHSPKPVPIRRRIKFMRLIITYC